MYVRLNLTRDFFKSKHIEEPPTNKTRFTKSRTTASAKITSILKIKNFSKSSFGVDVPDTKKS